MKVRATEVGYDNIKLRKPGDIFEWPDGTEDHPNPLPSWCQDPSLPFSTEDDEQKQKEATQAKEPQTYSEVSKGRKKSKFGGVEVPT